MALTPEFLWAQTKDQLYLTVSVPNINQTTCEIKLENSPAKVVFKGRGGVNKEEQDYVLDIELLKDIVREESRYNVGARNVQFKLKKAQDAQGFWDRLLKSSAKNVHCKVDWDHWRDEDEEQDVEFGAGWDSSNMANLDLGAKMDEDEADMDDSEDDGEHEDAKKEAAE
mmetsp:Transcript_6221/g.11239  ORF Transcript_6221/g.11239 Transcript_6221/m.11239 type:complete len:169 (-) Transcript_6221:1990-2496(-)